MKIPSLDDVVRVGTEQVEALAALPLTAVELNTALINLTKTVQRLDGMIQRADKFSESLEELAPKLQALAPLFDEEVIKSLPEIVTAFHQSFLPAVQVVLQTQAQLGAIATSLERLDRIMEESVSRFNDLPGVGLVNRLLQVGQPAKPASEPAETEAGETP